MAPIALGSPIHRYTPLEGLRKLDKDELDGFGTRAIHVGSDPDPTTGAVIPAISLSTTYKQEGVGNHKVSRIAHKFELLMTPSFPTGL
jgi:cystathionine gamma-lyase